MVYENRQTAAHQHHQEDKVEKVRPAKPPREAMHSGESGWIKFGKRREIGQSEDRCLSPGQRQRNDATFILPLPL